ncbi:hypothetical protein [Aurantimonas coralicida]|uniref:hypothetical protein n=1 Tax=Aurantimonas coralicida TaxID=182270 RepID=UPI0003F5295D|nr:hypothetical protein [Aurantimonas coralicida]
MPRYATGTAEAGSGYELYDISDHANDRAAIAAFEANMKEQRPDLRLAKTDPNDLEVYDCVARVTDDLPLDAETITDDDIVELVETYDVRAIDEAAA